VGLHFLLLTQIPKRIYKWCSAAATALAKYQKLIAL